MSVKCEVIDLVIPISKIDKVYEGGFRQFKEERMRFFGKTLLNDDHLFVTSVLKPIDLELYIKIWEQRGLQGTVEINGKQYWKDFCVVECQAGGPTLPCEWIEYDQETHSVSMKDQ
jgi:hypothetical protein